MSKIRFEIINGTLCRMVEPEPLTENAQYPCVVKLIGGNDTSMGRYNYSTVCCSKDFDAMLAIGTGSLMFHYTRYEILGYPVEEGSHWWALYQMMQGHEIINSNGTIPFCHHEDRILRCGDDISWDIGHWLRIYDDTRGWQLYEPEPEPKFAVGDWVEIEQEYAGNIKRYHRKVELYRETLDAYSMKTIVCGEFEFTVDGEPYDCPYHDNWHPEHRIVRKLDPSEVVIHIGCLSGTVKKSAQFANFIALINDVCIAHIAIYALDEPTQTLVRELLEKQGEGK